MEKANISCRMEIYTKENLRMIYLKALDNFNIKMEICNIFKNKMSNILVFIKFNYS